MAPGLANPTPYTNGTQAGTTIVGADRIRNHGLSNGTHTKTNGINGHAHHHPGHDGFDDGLEDGIEALKAAQKVVKNQWVALNDVASNPNAVNATSRSTIRGATPHGLGTYDVQSARCLNRLRSKKDELDKYEYLAGLRSTNTHLFYRVLIDNLQELTPLVYTPTIGLACQRFSHIFAHHSDGLYLSYEDRGHIQEVLDGFPLQDVSITVVTDGSRILGLGDLGLNGMGIPIGKLSLYVACAGIHPSHTLPVVFDLGTNNEDNLSDPLYLGLRRKRVSHEEAVAFVDEFMSAVQKRWPGIIIQFEDFKTELAFDLLETHRVKSPSFNDDIQGTGAVTLSGFINAIRLSGTPVRDQRFVFFGAGSAAVGIAQMMCEYLIKKHDIPEQQAKEMFWLVDSKGLVANNRGDVLPSHKVYFSRTDPSTPRLTNLQSVVEHVRPTGLLGLSTVGSTFTEPIIRYMAEINNRPIIFPLSNPVSKSECTFAEAVEWTDGKVLFASGSPFDPVEYKAKVYPHFQGNNMYIFPGLGLAAILSKVSIIPEELVHAAAEGLAISLTEDELANSYLYPDLRRIREVSVVLTRKVIREAQRMGIDRAPELRKMEDGQLDSWIEGQMYDPRLEGKL